MEIDNLELDNIDNNINTYNALYYIQKLFLNINDIGNYYKNILNITTKLLKSKYGYLTRINYDDEDNFVSQNVLALSTSITDDAHKDLLETFKLKNDGLKSYLFYGYNSVYNISVKTKKVFFTNNLQKIVKEHREKKKENIQFRCPFIPKGKLKMTSYFSIPILNEKKKVEYIFAVTEPINSDYNYDEKLFETNKTYFKFIALHLKTIKNGQMILNKNNQNHKFKEKFKYKARFFANMSHETRTPMNGLLGMLTLLKMDSSNLNIMQKEYIDLAIKSSENLMNLLNDVLLLSNKGSSDIKAEEHCCKLNELIEEVIIIKNENNRKSKNVEIVYYIDNNIPLNIITDPAKLKQILYNLVDNAIKYTKSGHVSIEVHLKSSDPFNLEFEVYDTGIGITKNKIDSLFESFTQINHRISKSTSGSGLGLSICKFLVNLLGGSINVVSKIGRGSTFTFDILANVNYKHFGISETEIQLKKTIENMNIYILDKNPLNCLLMLDLLIKLCQHIDYGRNISDSLSIIKSKFIKKKQYDILILDYDIHNIDYNIIIKEIKSYHTNVKIILTSIEDKKNINTNLFDAYIKKPLRQNNFLTTIDEMFNKKEQQEQLPDIDENDEFQKNINILIVEDNNINRKILKELLKHNGYINIYEADNGLSALQLSNMNFDIVFMDLHMPIMDGLQATTIIREKDKNIPIYAITADVSVEIKKQCKQIGFTDFLTKPFEIDKILKIIKHISFNKNNILNVHILDDLKKSMTDNEFKQFFINLFNKLNNFLNSLEHYNFESSSIKTLKDEIFKIRGSLEDYGMIKLAKDIESLEIYIKKEIFIKNSKEVDKDILVNYIRFAKVSYFNTIKQINIIFELDLDTNI